MNALTSNIAIEAPQSIAELFPAFEFTLFDKSGGGLTWVRDA